MTGNKINLNEKLSKKFVFFAFILCGLFIYHAATNKKDVAQKNINQDSGDIDVGIGFVWVNIPSFDCNKPISLADSIVCSDNQLSRMDYEVNNLYKQTLEVHGGTYGYIEGQDKTREIRNNCMDKYCVLRWYQERADFYNSVILASSFSKLKDPSREKGTSQMMLIHNSNDTVCNEDYKPCSKEQFNEVYNNLQKQWDLTPEWVRLSCNRYNTAGMMLGCIMGQTRAFIFNFPQARVDWIYVPNQN